ncbi:hypothetical protein QTL95_11670 [Rhizobium sp. S152]|uniref:hypothetical protein n=1 Tax=Rhizobium sp. S152 TaxID=3055038 RepID=UPI0025A96BCE|nr:hypothetical protein [Rhizobium sp. S152]MDM9626558.1 hypothetical protein [Rhizobium sp. S152]
MRTLDNFAWALSGKGPSGLPSNEFRGEFGVWQSVAFYNYIPVILADSARSDRPTAEHFAMAVEPFERVLNDLKPQVLVVWGYSLFPYVIRNHWPSALPKPWDFNGNFVDVGMSDPIRAIRMLHPSAAFSHNRWHTILSEAVVEIK